MLILKESFIKEQRQRTDLEFQNQQLKEDFNKEKTEADLKVKELINKLESKTQMLEKIRKNEERNEAIN